jgi:3-methylcrotonyl-CoA carboxylase alpha subunit
VQVTLERGEWSLRLLDPYAPPGGEAAAGGRLAAPIPGRVVQVLVAEGDHVARGQVLAVLEAMKTELRITAPADGVVAHVGCAAGDSVEEGTEIVTLATEGD